MTRFRVALVSVGAVAVVLFVVAQIAVPLYVAQRVEESLGAHFPTSTAIEAKFTAFPIFRVAQGRFDSVVIDVIGPDVGGLELESFAVRGRNVRLDPADLVRGMVTVRSAEALYLEANIDEAGLTRYVRASLEGASDVRVELRDGTAVLLGAVSLLGRSLDVEVSGQVVVAGTSRIRFVPSELKIDNQSIPRGLIEAITSGWDWDLDLSSLPLPVQLDWVEVTSGTLSARGTWVQLE